MLHKDNFFFCMSGLIRTGSDFLSKCFCGFFSPNKLKWLICHNTAFSFCRRHSIWFQRVQLHIQTLFYLLFGREKKKLFILKDEMIISKLQFLGFYYSPKTEVKEYVFFSPSAFNYRQLSHSSITYNLGTMLCTMGLSTNTLLWPMSCSRAPSLHKWHSPIWSRVSVDLKQQLNSQNTRRWH